MTEALKIAVPKGSLYADGVRCLQNAGLDVRGLAQPERQLVFYNQGVEFYILRPTDVPTFVAAGTVDLGICGKDSLVEAGLSLAELVDLHFGACRFVVALPEGRWLPQGETIRVATKYPHIAAAHFAAKGVQTEIIKMHGNVELAPLAGIADCIVDITATGRTLRENKLSIVEDVLAATARLVANVAALRVDSRVRELADQMRALV
ncbi:MAG: ATP phosphoribosyltransferase [Coriobacteriales bacterium]|jgi:ATP phosphoribosyltransferase regulatory subunit|nr:ATP phosphoribosyltransferase [Coriobacteriales bacterium]